MIYENKPESESQLFTDVISQYPKDTPIIGIEIGVLNGATSRHLLSIHKNLHLFLIDPFVRDSMEKSLIGSEKNVKENLKEYKGRYTLKKNFSSRVVSDFNDNEIDFVFIDGSHLYHDVKYDYELYYPKIKKGGKIFIHDSRMNRDGPKWHVGPSQFTDELVSSGLQPKHEAFSLTMFIKGET